MNIDPNVSRGHLWKKSLNFGSHPWKPLEKPLNFVTAGKWEPCLLLPPSPVSYLYLSQLWCAGGWNGPDPPRASSKVLRNCSWSFSTWFWKNGPKSTIFRNSQKKCLEHAWLSGWHVKSPLLNVSGWRVEEGHQGHFGRSQFGRSHNENSLQTGSSLSFSGPWVLVACRCQPPARACVCWVFFCGCPWASQLQHRRR